jgi:hypothetical protein
MPGDYSLLALVYGEEDQRPLPVLPGGGREFSLGTLHLLPPEQTSVLAELPPSPALRTSGGDLELYVENLALPPHPRPGDAITLDLLWRAPLSPAAKYVFQLDLQRGKLLIPLLASDPLGGQAYPVNRWRAGETLRQRYTALIPPAVAGDFTLTARVYLPGETPAQAEIAPLTLTDWQHVFDLPPDAVPLAAQFIPLRLQSDQPAENGGILLAGYNLKEQPGALNLTLYWRADATPKKTYTVFVHLLDETGSLMAQIDRPPVAGQKPMTGWLPGEIISDALSLPLPDGVLPEQLQVEVGLYDPDTLQRLSVCVTRTCDDKIIVNVIKK